MNRYLPITQPEVAAEYRERGYIVLRGLLPPALIEEVRNETKRVFAAAETGAVAERVPDDDEFNALLRRMFAERFDAYRGAGKLANHLVSLHRLSLDPRIIEALRALGLSFPTICARPLMWFHVRHLAKTDRYFKLPAHQEWSNMQGSLDGAVAWLPLVHVDPEMGRLQVIPGSHKQGLLRFNRQMPDYPLATDESALEDDAFEEVEVGFGDVLILSAFLVHRSGHNNTDRVRWTINFRYNNAAEPTFIGRDFLNPFIYDAAVDLKTPNFPAPEQVRHLFDVKHVSAA